MNAVLELPRSVFGVGAVDGLAAELSALGVARPLLISDRGLRDAGLIDRVLRVLPGWGAVFDGVTPNPVYADVEGALSLYQASGCDGVVALGGGSVIDVAKYVALLVTHGGQVCDYVNRPDPFVRPAAPLVAVPTTAGTGSEASPDAGIHPDGHSASVGVSSRRAVPRAALLDPGLTTGLPPRMTAATGIDALTHCIEGFLSIVDSPVADTLALDGIRRVMSHVDQATRHGDDLVARGEMLVAGYLGGVAIGMGLGPAHAIAITCGDQGLHHGVLSGIGCVASLDAVLAQVPHKLAPLCAALGIDSPHGSPSQILAATMRRLGLPATLKEAGYHVHDIALLAQKANHSVFNRSSRWHPSAATYLQWLEASASGFTAA